MFIKTFIKRVTTVGYLNFLFLSVTSMATDSLRCDTKALMATSLVELLALHGFNGDVPDLSTMNSHVIKRSSGLFSVMYITTAGETQYKVLLSKDCDMIKEIELITTMSPSATAKDLTLEAMFNVAFIHGISKETSLEYYLDKNGADQMKNLVVKTTVGEYSKYDDYSVTFCFKDFVRMCRVKLE